MYTVYQLPDELLLLGSRAHHLRAPPVYRTLTVVVHDIAILGRAAGIGHL